MRASALVAAALSLVLAGLPPATASAGDGVPGEAGELTNEVRATAQKHVDAIVKQTPDAEKATRALLVLGPAVWPVIDNAIRLVPPDAAKPRLTYLKALLSKKVEPDFEHFRARIRKTILVGSLEAVLTELQNFRLGRPDPEKPGKKIPNALKPVIVGTTSVYRSSDGTITLAYGGDATDKRPDAPDVNVNEPTAGFVAAIGGRAHTAERHSGRGATVTCVAPLGFAWAWATDGAPGVKPDGGGGEAGVADAQGGVGQWMHQGKVGANAVK